MNEKPRRQKTIVVGVRLPEAEYYFLKAIADDMSKYYEVSVSQLAKMMIDYFLMAFSIGELKKPMKEVRERFLQVLEELNPNKKNKNKSKENKKR